MMILVSISRRSGLFQYLAIWSAQRVKANPAGILLMLQLATRYSFHRPQQRHHRAVDRAGDAGDRRGTRTAAVSILVRRGVCLEYRRNGDVDRRPAQHFDRLAGWPRLQCLSRQHRAGSPADHGGAGGDDSLDLGPFDARQSGKPRPGHGHECAGNDHRLGAAAPVDRGHAAVLARFCSPLRCTFSRRRLRSPAPRR